MSGSNAGTSIENNVKISDIRALNVVSDTITFSHSFTVGNPQPTSSLASGEIPVILNQESYTRDLKDFPLNDLPSGGSSFPIRISPSEMIIAKMDFSGFAGGRISWDWYNTSGTKVYGGYYDAPSGNGWIWSFIGHFAWEITVTGTYYVIITTPNGSARIDFSVINTSPIPSNYEKPYSTIIGESINAIIHPFVVTQRYNNDFNSDKIFYYPISYDKKVIICTTFKDSYFPHIVNYVITNMDTNLVYKYTSGYADPGIGYYYKWYSNYIIFSYTGKGTFKIQIFVDTVEQISQQFRIYSYPIKNGWNIKLTVPITNTGNIKETFYADAYIAGNLFGLTEPSITLLPGQTGNLVFNGSLTGLTNGFKEVKVNVFKSGDTKILSTKSDSTILEVVG